MAITISILLDISRSKGNQTIKFGQIIEFNIDIFLEKSCTKRDGKSRSLFFLPVQVEDYQNVLELKC